jgi:hypothetical protein
MLEIQPEIVSSLREMAGRGVTPSRMLREILGRFDLEEPRAGFLVWYCHEAFGLQVYQMNAIFNWDIFGTGGFNDGQVDHFLGRHLKTADWPGKTSEVAAHASHA